MQYAADILSEVIFWCNEGVAPVKSILHGLLYNFYAVEDARGLAPEGTHIPSVAEFEELTDYYGGELTAGGELKAVHPSWLDPNVGASNSSGFTAYCSNFRFDDGNFADETDAEEGMYCNYYSNETTIDDSPYFLFLRYDEASAVVAETGFRVTVVMIIRIMQLQSGAYLMIRSHGPKGIR